MTRLSVLSVLLIGLSLIGCAPVSPPTDQTPAVAGEQEPATGTRIPGVTPASPGTTVGRDQIDQTNSSNWADVLNHSSASTILHVTH
jgi:hypothetical protein